MKKILLLLMTLLPLYIQAADKNENSNPKYLKGAINLIDGKVTFETEIDMNGMKAEEVYNKAAKWADEKFQVKEDFRSRVAYKNAEETELAVVGDEYIVFKSTALSLDRTRIYYQLRITAENGKCKMSMTNIRYWYEENRDGGERYSAEEWITDDMALNKKGTKLSPITGKFRRETIDLKDEIFKSAQIALNGRVINSNREEGFTTLPAHAKETSQHANLENVEVNNLPSDINKTISQSKIILEANGEQIQIENDNWGGMGKMLNKDVAYIIVSPAKIVANALLSSSADFCIKIYVDHNSKESIVMECKKAIQQKMSTKELKSFNPNLKGEQDYNMYICEIKKVMMR